MIGNGYAVFRPEEHPIRDQMIHYLNASEIVFSEGSAIHLIDIMPRLKARVAVVARRERTLLPRTSLIRKCVELQIYTDCIALGHPYRPQLGVAMGLTWIDPARVLAFLKGHGFVEALPGTNFFDDDTQLISDITEYFEFHRSKRGPAKQGAGNLIMNDIVRFLAKSVGLRGEAN